MIRRRARASRVIRACQRQWDRRSIIIERRGNEIRETVKISIRRKVCFHYLEHGVVGTWLSRDAKGGTMASGYPIFLQTHLCFHSRSFCYLFVHGCVTYAP